MTYAPAILGVADCLLLGKSDIACQKVRRARGWKCQESLMSIRAIPLLVFAFVLYNAIVLSLGDEALAREIFELRLLSGGVWKFTWGDFILLVTLVLLFVEIVKSTFTTTSTLIDHALSMLVFMAVGAEFLIVPQAATSVFFLILIATLIDVIGGYTIGIRVARRDLSIGADQ
jgi:hypothetical protein